MLTRQTRKEMNKDEDIANPSNKDIWNLLLEIQKNITKLLNDSQEHRSRKDEFKKSLEFEASKREELQNKVSSLEKELKESQTKVNSLEENALKLDDLEKYTRKYNLEISGVAMDAHMTDCELVLAISEEIGVKMRSKDLDIIHRLKVKNGIELLIVRFMSYQVKQHLYKAKKNCCNKDWSSIIGASTSVYINENQTRRRAQLFKKAREAAKSKGIYGCWTIDGMMDVGQ